MSFQPLPDDDGRFHAHTVLAQLAGYASVAWKGGEVPKGVFDEGGVIAAVDTVEQLLDCDSPKLGLATTRELFVELEARFRTHYRLPGDANMFDAYAKSDNAFDLDYRPVD